MNTSKRRLLQNIVIQFFDEQFEKAASQLNTEFVMERTICET